MATRIKLRRDTAANWTAQNPVLANGEAGYEYDTAQIKIGDGSTDWVSLGYVQALSGIADGDYGDITITAGTWAVDALPISRITNLQTSLDVKAESTFSTLAVSGQSDVVADSSSDTLTLVAGTNITITTDAATDSITINASGGVSDGDKGDVVVSGSGSTWTLDTVNSNVGSFGSASTSGTFTVNAKGLITAASSTTISIPSTQVTGLGTLATQSGTFSGTSSGTNTGDQTSIVGITGTKAQFDTAVTDGNILYVGDITQYTDELAQDAVGTILTDSAEIDFTYNDGAPSITASIVSGSIDETKLDASVNASLDLADSAAQASFTTIVVAGQSDVVADSSSDTLTLAAGSNITLTTNAGSDTITISASGGGGGGTTVNTGSVTADFGYSTGDEGDMVTVVVSDSNALTASKILVTPRYSSALTDHDAEDYAVEGIQATVGSITNGVGFEIHVSSRYFTWGQYNIDYIII